MSRRLSEEVAEWIIASGTAIRIFDRLTFCAKSQEWKAFEITYQILVHTVHVSLL